MSGTGGRAPDDAELVAFLDGQLPLLRRTTVQSWLDADPAAHERLASIAAGRPAGKGPAATPALFATRVRRPRAAAIAAVLAAGLAAFALGVGAGRWLLPAPASGPPPRAAIPGGWRQAVAEYFSLDTASSLAAIPDDPTVLQRELDAAAARLKLALPAASLALPGFALKRADVFAFRGRPLAEILYLDPRRGPVALCMIANGRPDAGLETETREGLNLVYWQRHGLGFLIIGRLSAAELMQAAKSLTMRLEP